MLLRGSKNGESDKREWREISNTQLTLASKVVEEDMQYKERETK